MAQDPNVSELEKKLSRLKRDYDLFLAGQLRVEPIALRREIEREIMHLTRSFVPSTVVKFRIKTLAHRYRSLETQLRNLMDLRVSRKPAAEESSSQTSDSIIVDQIAIDNPSVIAARVRTILRNAAKSADPNAPAALDISPEAFCQVLVNRARTMVGKNHVSAIRFRIVPGENGPRVKGELLKNKMPDKPEDPQA
jgi:hypothetical protein